MFIDVVKHKIFFKAVLTVFKQLLITALKRENVLQTSYGHKLLFNRAKLIMLFLY